MPGIDRTTGRVIALIVLLVLAAAALRGYVPPAARASPHQTTGGGAALVPVVVLLAVSLGIVAVSIINRVRHRRAVAGSFGTLSAGLGGGKGPPSSRVLLVGLVVISAWLLIMWLLTRLVGPHGSDQLVQVPGADTAVPATDTAPPPTGTAPPPTDTAPRPERPRQNPGGDAFGYIAAAAVGMLLLIVAGNVVTARTRRAGLKPPSLPDERLGPAVPDAGPESLVRAAELGLAEIGDLAREPREAIIACYATMERELANVPDAVPQDFDTPTEVLARAVEHRALPVDNATKLVSLFAEARFSSHLMTEAHREDAERILRLVLAELRRPV